MSRPSFDELFLEIAHVVAKRATCPRLACGCVLVRDNHAFAMGYNGSLPGAPHCLALGCDMVAGHCVRAMHSEANALLQAGRHGVSTVGATAYVTHSPCWMCFKQLVRAGVVRVVFTKEYAIDVRVWVEAARSGVALQQMAVKA